MTRPPGLEPAARELELGELGWDETKTVSVALRNETDGPVEIVGVDKECGCTDANVADGELAPGESTTLTATYESGRGDGPIAKGVSVLYRSLPPDGPESAAAPGPLRRIDVRLTGRTVPQFRFEPATLTFDGRNAGPVTLAAVPVRAERVEMTRVLFGTPALTAEPAADGGFRVTYDPAAGYGEPESRATVEVSFTPAGGEPATDFFFLPVSLRGPPSSPSPDPEPTPCTPPPRPPPTPAPAARSISSPPPCRCLRRRASLSTYTAPRLETPGAAATIVRTLEPILTRRSVPGSSTPAR